MHVTIIAHAPCTVKRTELGTGSFILVKTVKCPLLTSDQQPTLVRSQMNREVGKLKFAEKGCVIGDFFNHPGNGGRTALPFEIGHLFPVPVCAVDFFLGMPAAFYGIQRLISVRQRQL